MRRLLLRAVAIVAATLLAFPAPAMATTCRRHQGHEICLEQVQRSAKYHWRYRVRASVDGELQPLTRYNCRDRTRTVIEGSQRREPEAFSAVGVGNLVCKLLDR